MSASDVKIAAARGQAEARRQELMGTIDEIKVRLAPKTIAQGAWEGAKDKSSEVADTTMTAVKERPAVAAGVAAGLALLIARKPLFSLVSGLFSSKDSNDIETDEE